MRNIQIGIIGPEKKNMPVEIQEKYLALAYEMGKILAERKAILITGGCCGVAQAASEGALSAGGITVGTPGPRRGSAVESTVVEICTPIDVGDYLFAGILSCDAIIVFPGDAGTLAELAIAYRYKKPLILLEGISAGILEKLFFKVDQNYPQYLAASASEAVDKAILCAQKFNKDMSNGG